MNIIEVENLTQDYGHGRGVFDVTFSVKEGEVFGFLGPNGAGKSTTIRHIMGFSRPQKGDTKLFGQETFHNYYKILGKVGYLPGEIALPEGLSGWEFIDMMCKLRNIDNKERLNYLLDKFKLNPDAETKKMSLGDKRKLAIVTAFMHDPEVLILDEPTSAMDAISEANLYENFKNLFKDKGVIFISHRLSSTKICDRIIVLNNGKIIETGTHNELMKNDSLYKELFSMQAEYYKEEN